MRHFYIQREYIPKQALEAKAYSLVVTERSSSFYLALCFFSGGKLGQEGRVVVELEVHVMRSIRDAAHSVPRGARWVKLGAQSRNNQRPCSPE
jgi:hypothetical protein